MRGGRSRERGSFDTGEEEEDEEKEEEEKEEEREVLRVASQHKRLYDRRPFRSMKIAQAARYQPDTRSFWPGHTRVGRQVYANIGRDEVIGSRYMCVFFLSR